MKRSKAWVIVVSNMEQLRPDRQTHTLFPNRKSNTEVRQSTYLEGVELEDVPPSCVGGSTCVGRTPGCAPTCPGEMNVAAKVALARSGVSPAG